MTATKDQEKASVFTRQNYLWMLVGLVVIVLGFILMAGGGSDDPNVFKAEEIYSFRRITLAPILVLAGFAIEIAAIFRKPA
ncbi:MAG: DUF3098 domain-containing protein [Bacteroidetes bacterium]|nr:DUF3098 domain-containing protein [Bacteroidota bacterium]